MKKHILIIDDEESIRDLMKLLLERHDYRITAVGNKQDALKVARVDAPALIISDLQLGEEDGLVVLRELKKMLPHAPSILLTGMPFSPEVIASVEKTVSAYLPKTSTLITLAKLTKQLLGEDHESARPTGTPQPAV